MTERERQILEAEKDPRILRALIASMAEHIEKQKAIIDRIEAEKAKASQAGFIMEEQVKLLRRQVYGRKKEDRAEATDRPRDKSQEQAQLFSQSAFPSPEKRSENKKSKHADLEERIIDIEMSEEALLAEARSRGVQDPKITDWKDTGLFEACTKIQIIERSYVKEIHRRKKYKLNPARLPDSEKEVIVTAFAEPELLPGMNYTTEFVASVVSDKYISHVPLERQTREMESLGLLGMQNSTLSRLSGLAAASLEPLQEKILEELKQSDLALHLDETPWKIQKKDEKDGYLWVISNRYGSYYFFKPTRSAKVITEKLKGYTGPAVTDGWNSYVEVLVEAGIPQGFCWAHARREFLPLEGHDPTIKPILDEIDKLFAIERKAKSFEELKDLREKKSRSVVEKIRSLLRSEYPKSREGSHKRKAILYLETRWDGFTKFLTDTRVPLSNNEAERTIRHAVVGRKNYYGSGNHVGAETAATLFTVIETCKKNDLDPRSYLLHALKTIAKGEKPLTPLETAKLRSQ
jgi:transposase